MDLKYTFEAIVFDLGNVLLPIDPQKTVDAFTHLSGKEQGKDTIAKHAFFNQHEMGLISDEEFINEVRLLLEKPELKDTDIIDAWNALLLDFLPLAIPLIEKLSAYYPVYLLSNTNHIHIRYIDDILLKGRPDLSSHFARAFYSFEMGKRKPNIDIYEELIESIGLPADKLIFVDDNKDNIISAAKLGIQVFHNEYPEAHFTMWEKLNL